MQNASPGVEDSTVNPLISSPSKENKVVMVIVDRMVLEDLRDPSLANIHKVFKNGAVSLMNCNTAGNNLFSENTYATIGAGSHIDGNRDLCNGSKRKRKAGKRSCRA